MVDGTSNELRRPEPREADLGGRHAAHAPSPHAPSPHVPPGGSSGAAKPAVLVVDDRLENLLALEAILEPLNARLLRATSADEALRHVLMEDFACILLDVQMPGTSGLETARLIKQRGRSRGTPIIFLTALDHDRRRVTLGYEYGAVDYLFKPLDADVLRAKVAVFLELYQKREELAWQKRRRYADDELRASEERYRLVQKATNDVIWDWDLTTDELSWNDLAYEVFRYRPGQVPDDALWRQERIHPDDRERVVSSIHAVIDGAGDGHSWAAEYRFRLGDGSYGTFLDRGYVTRDDSGRPVRMIGAMQDVTERMRTERERDRALAEAEAARATAEAASRAKSEFLATMSHELRTPLNAILGYTQLLDMGVLGPVTPEQHAHLERLRASGLHLLGLVNDVLDLAKVDAGGLAVAPARALAGEAVDAALSLIRPQAVGRGITLSHHADAGHEVRYEADPDRVRQILVNLLSNAVKFSQGGGEVVVTCGTVDAAEPGARLSGPGPWTYLRVRDSGIGIPAEDLGRIFEPFVQGDSGRTRERGGTGLGLTISRRLARLMGGDVTVRSQVGQGSVFTLWLPAAGGALALSTGPAGLTTPAAASLDDATYEAVRAIGVRLTRAADAVVSRYTARLRTDASFPGADALPEAQLRDHAATVVSEIATALTVLGEMRGVAPDLLRDGGEIQRFLAELHGAQRYRLGWGEAQVEREKALLWEELQAALAVAGSDVPSEHSAAAARYAGDVARHILEQAIQTSLRAHRFASAANER